MIDYSTCYPDAPVSKGPDDINAYEPMPSSNYNFYFKTATMDGELPTWRTYNITKNYTSTVSLPNVPVCSIEFQIPDNMGPPVLFYYRLTNFYQNHRRYVKSLDSNQLLGQNESSSTIANGFCTPLTTEPVTGRPYYPCGLIANSLFNDTFYSPVLLNTVNSSSDSAVYPMTDQGIAWSSDGKLYGKTTYNYSQIAVPPNWYDRYGPDGYTNDNPPPDLSTDEAFQVWMRTAGLPAFSKLALRNDNQTMTSGRYSMEIEMSMVQSFERYRLSPFC